MLLSERKRRHGQGGGASGEVPTPAPTATDHADKCGLNQSPGPILSVHWIRDDWQDLGREGASA
jgi:hypothetical protein